MLTGMLVKHCTQPVLLSALFYLFVFSHVVGSIVNLHGLVGALYTSEDVSVPVILSLRLIGKQALPLDAHLVVL